MRLTEFLASAQALYVPALFIAAAALMLRSASYLLGYAACLPWIAINLFFSLTPAAQTLSLYYGFPLLVGLAWPLLAGHWGADRAGKFAVPVCVGACVLSAAVLPFHYDVLAASRAGGDLSSAVYLRQRACLESEFRSDSRLFADIAVVAMFPHSVPSRRVLRSAEDVARAPADSLIFYENAIAPAYYDRAQAAGLQRSVVLRMPPIRLLSREPSQFAACIQR